MKTLCVYCTRSGYTKQMADQVAKTLNADLLLVTNGKDYHGAWGYIKAAVCGLKKKMPALLPSVAPSPFEEYDRIVVAAPVWCEDICILMRAFLRRNQEKLKGKLYYVINHMSNLSYEEKIKELSFYTGREVTQFVSLQTKNHDWTAELTAFLQQIQ